ncbi:hypothetical protein D5R40_29935 [Okeania hirsuta]|uniref:Uncharacterized protein n=1 Tax=Okeania hirsuta TaxID=1458930 RepID=A0A3N6PFA3_9CYAN|nr:hypothetical protein D5R40_29935 [Okeania hirsuta]
MLAYDLRCHGKSEGVKKGLLEWVILNGRRSLFLWIMSVQGLKHLKWIFPDEYVYGCQCNPQCNGERSCCFRGVKSLLAIAPLKGRTTIERNCETWNRFRARSGSFRTIYKGITGLSVDDHNIIPKAEFIIFLLLLTGEK